MKKIIIFIFGFLFYVPAAFPQYENADAVYDLITKEYTLKEDGTIDFRCIKQLKLLSHLSFNRLYGETFIIYNPDFQKLKINNSYTIMANGDRLDAPGNAFNEVLPRFAAHSATFNNLREMVVTHTGTEIGATLYLDYTITTHNDFWPALMGNETIEESSPVTIMKVIVRVPAETELYYRMYNLRTSPEIMVEQKEKVYTWYFAGLPASPKETNTGDFPVMTPRLVFSTMNNFDDPTNWLLETNNVNYQLSGDLKIFADSVRDKNTDEIALLSALQEYVVKNLAFDNIPPEIIGYRVRTPEKVWYSNGGTELEKSLLLVALLREAGIRALPVLTGPGQFLDKNIASLLLLNHVFVLATTKNFGDFYLSATRSGISNPEYSSPGSIFIPVDAGRKSEFIQPSKADNRIFFSADFKADSLVQMFGDGVIQASWALNPFFSVSSSSDNIKKILGGSITGGDIKSVEKVSCIPEKSEFKLKIEKKEPFTQQDGYYRWECPVVQNGFESFHIGYLPAKRTSVFEIPFPVAENYHFTLTIPEGYAFINVKSRDEIKNKAGEVKTEISVKGNVITIERFLKINNYQIAPDVYTDFRILVNAWLDRNKRTLIFEKTK